MACNKTRELLSEYIDGLLSEETSRQIEEHLSGCSECNQLYNDILECTSMLKDIKDTPPPAGLNDMIMGAVFPHREVIDVRRTNVTGSFKKRYKRLSALAAIFLVGIFATAMYNNMDKIIDSTQYSNISKPPAAISSDSKNEEQQKKVTNSDSDNVPEKDNAISYSVVQSLQGNQSEDSEVIQKEMQNSSHENMQKYNAGYPFESRGAPSGDRIQFNQSGASDPQSPICRGARQHSAFQVPFDCDDLNEIQVYMYCLDQELIGIEFNVLACENLENGKWRFTVDTGSEIIYYLGQDGKIWIEETEESLL